MRWVVGGSLLAVISIAASQARAEESETAVASRYEAWQIIAEAQLARVIAVDPATTVGGPVPAIAEQIQSSDVKTEKPSEAAPVKVAASQTESGVATASLAEPAATSVATAPVQATPSAMPAHLVLGILNPPMPRIRPVTAPPPPIVNSREDICNTLAESAQKHNLPLAFFGNLIYQESGLKPRVVSHVGARGIAQFMPGTARMVGLRNPFNPREALPASAKFLRSLLRQFDNNYGLAAAAYNAGPGKVSRWLKRRTVLPKETRDYVKTITGQQAEHWRGIRGNRFGHRLARRMPCANMVQFAYANEETVVEKGVLHSVFMTLPRPHPLRAASQLASAVPMHVSLTTAANAEPAPIAAAATPAATPAPKDEERVSTRAPVAAAAPVAVAAATESMALPRVMAPSAEQTTGTVTSVTKAAPAPHATPEKIASLAPAGKSEIQQAKFVAPLPRANPLREARLAEKHGDKRVDKKSDKKSDKKAEAKKSASKKRRG